MKNGYFVYKHTCPNGKIYIGITCQTPSKRWANGKGYAPNAYFSSAIQKYGWDNIRHEILFDSLTKEQAEQKEIELIAEYKSNQREYGYNISVGGECGALKYITPIVCPICGKAFKQRDFNNKYCSRECAEQARAHYITFNGETRTATEWSKILNVPRYTIVERHKKGYDIASGKPPRVYVCASCRKEFVPNKAKQKYCCPECQKRAMRKRPLTAICKQCGKEFPVKRDSKGLYCSRECQWKSMRKD